MSDEYEFYQGVVLRQLVVNTDFVLMLRPFETQGRISSFVVNGRVGVFIKHSAKRMSPWRFTFAIEQVSDLLDLTTSYSDSFVVFVCGDDGLVTLPVSKLYEIVSFQGTEKVWIRVERPPRSQYAVSGNKSEIPHKISNGIFSIIDTIRLQAKGLRAS